MVEGVQPRYSTANLPLIINYPSMRGDSLMATSICQNELPNGSSTTVYKYYFLSTEHITLSLKVNLA